jgi:hypothetical protein
MCTRRAAVRRGKSLAPHSRLKLIAALREQSGGGVLLLLVPLLRALVLYVPPVRCPDLQLLRQLSRISPPRHDPFESQSAWAVAPAHPLASSSTAAQTLERSPPLSRLHCEAEPVLAGEVPLHVLHHGPGALDRLP